MASKYWSKIQNIILKFYDMFAFDTLKSFGKNISLPLNKITKKLNGNKYV